jgi:hypothetical protein
MVLVMAAVHTTNAVWGVLVVLDSILHHNLRDATDELPVGFVPFHRTGYSRLQSRQINAWLVVRQQFLMMLLFLLLRSLRQKVERVLVHEEVNGGVWEPVQDARHVPLPHAPHPAPFDDFLNPAPEAHGKTGPVLLSGYHRVNLEQNG